MTLLILGLLLWSVVHFYNRAAPASRAALTERFGNGARGIIAGLILISVILMIIGYKRAPFTPIYDPPSWGVHLNNLLMFCAIALIGMGSSKGRLRAALRHPMLIGVVVWACAHLLANGDVASVILFGGMAIWAIAEMLVINASEGPWQRPEAGPAKGDLRLFIITAVLFVVIAGIHALVGPSPFPSGS